MTPQDEQPDLDRLRALETTGLLADPAPPEFAAICQTARERFGVAMALVTVVGEDRLVVKAAEGTDLREAPRLHQFCGHTVEGDEVLVVPDAREDPRFAANPLVRGRPFVRFYAGAPLHYVRHVRLGALCLLDPRPRDFPPEDRAELERMADSVAAAIVEREFDRLAASLAH
ncbi:PAS/PAC domain protein [Rubellimicrobium mesophilum DSM 19309]|uniref:PAS/PAC domain protein n=1 Tax=Rubellimicrobium mesophilum DSM 19309 TaxID=442562 RepID=A0A017HVM1_9RHOB|nr:GAF domain-containing protein [Rubellimicrobium mesophilum]EYD78203.1 PAS/PAC domain protein [Rubellimicrobium mesophilum DSM 19309]